MSNIVTVDPNEFLAQSKGRFFFIIYTNSQGSYFGLPGGGLQHIEHGFGGSPAVERNRLLNEYHSVLSSIRSNPILPDGRLDIVELPSYEQ